MLVVLQTLSESQQDLNTILLWVITILLIGRMIDRFFENNRKN